MESVIAFCAEHVASFSFVAGACITSLALSLRCVPLLRISMDDSVSSECDASKKGEESIFSSHPPSVNPSYTILVIGSFLGTLGACTMRGNLDHHVLHGKHSSVVAAAFAAVICVNYLLFSSKFCSSTF